ncbi:hypothetical protein K2Y11_21740 [bacterium]|nr:hypothetical protein [bacterium]
MSTFAFHFNTERTENCPPVTDLDGLHGAEFMKRVLCSTFGRSHEYSRLRSGRIVQCSHFSILSKILPYR